MLRATDAGLWLQPPGEGFFAASERPQLLVWTESDDGLTGSESTQNRKVAAIGHGFDR